MFLWSDDPRPEGVRLHTTDLWWFPDPTANAGHASDELALNGSYGVPITPRPAGPKKEGDTGMSKSVVSPLGSIVLATMATAVGAAVAAAQLGHVTTPSVAAIDPQPFTGDVSALGQHAGWILEASVDPNSQQAAYVGWTTISSQPLLNGDHGASAGTAGVAVDGISLQVEPLIGAVRAELGSVLAFEQRTLAYALDTTGSVVGHTVAMTTSVAHNAIVLSTGIAGGAVATAARAVNSTTSLAIGVANNAVTLATGPISANAALMGQSASTQRDSTGVGTQTSGMAPSGAAVGLSSGSANAAAGAAGIGASATVHLPLR